MAERLIIGHLAVKKFLEKSIESGRLAHAYMFVGVSGLGKKKVAEWFVGEIMNRQERNNLERDPSTPPAKILRSKTSAGFSQNDIKNSFQIRVIERVFNPKTGKKNKDISIEQIQEVQDFLSHSTFLGKIKAVIIEGAESLNGHAANALLKVLEEPRPNCFLILLSGGEEVILPTLVSRCQVVRFNQVATEEIQEGLVLLGADSQQAGEMSRLALGLPGRAVEFYREQEKLAVYQKQRDEFIKILTSRNLAASWQALEPYYTLSPSQGKNKKENHIETRETLISLLENWALFCRELMLAQAHEEKTAGPSLLKTSQALPKIWQSIEWLKNNIHPKLVLENLVLEINYAG